MPPPDEPFVVPLESPHFQVLVWLCRQPLHFRVLIAAPSTLGGPELSEAGLECTRDQLHEILTLGKTAIALIEHLQDGGAMELWGVPSPTPPNPDQKASPSHISEIHP